MEDSCNEQLYIFHIKDRLRSVTPSSQSPGYRFLTALGSFPNTLTRTSRLLEVDSVVYQPEEVGTGAF
jgi:hypothetical protein